MPMAPTMSPPIAGFTHFGSLGIPEKTWAMP